MDARRYETAQQRITWVRDRIQRIFTAECIVFQSRSYKQRRSIDEELWS